jgi:hypothetical protein
VNKSRENDLLEQLRNGKPMFSTNAEAAAFYRARMEKFAKSRGKTVYQAFEDAESNPIIDDEEEQFRLDVILVGILEDDGN